MIRISWTPAWRHGWHTAARALLAGFAAIGVAQAQPALHSIAPAPSWVLPVTPEAAGALPAEEVGRGVQYLLLDKQVRIGAQDRTTFQHMASKVLNEQGLENAANIEIRFDPSYQKLTLHAINLRRGAQVIAKLASAKVQILQRESALESLIFDGSRTAHVFLEDVRVGDVIEYAYSLRGGNPVFDNRNFGSFDFQFSAPVARLHARLLWPAGRPLYWKQLNEPPAAQVTEAGDSREYRWDLRDIAAKTVESDAPAWFDPYPSAQWSEFQSWQSVAAWATPLYALPPIPGPRVLAVINQIAHSEQQAPERLLAALQYVQSQVRYLGIEVGPGSHAPNPPELVLERRYGDCKDKTLLTVALLRGLGIAAQPALVHTNARHTIESQQPGPGAFNHVVVHARIGNRDIWLDPTRSPQRGSLDQLAQADFGRALIVDPGTLGLVPMAGREALALKREIHAVIDSTDGVDKPARYTVTTTARGAAADSLRNALDTQSRDQLQKQYLNYYTARFGEMEVTSPILVVDEHEANQVSVKEGYLLKAFWQASDKSRRREATVEVPDVLDYLQKPRTLVRSAPLSIPYPADFRQVTEVHLPDAWSIQPETLRVEDPAFEHERRSQWNASTHTLTITDQYKSRVDHVDPADIARYAANLEKARQNVSYVLYRNDGPVATAQGNSLHWLPAVLATLCLIGFGAAGWRLYQWDPEPRRMPETTFGPRPPKGIGGWLILPALGLPVSLFRMGRDVYQLMPSYTTNAWFALTDPAGANYHPLAGALLTFELVANAALIVLSITTLVLFFRRRSSLPTVYIAFLMAAFTVLLIDDLFALQVPAAAAAVTPKEWGALLRTFLSAAIWVAYFRRSERVRVTFVERWRRAPVAVTGPATGPDTVPVDVAEPA